jgi:LuxR family maltose regulon positive regulatory protein
LRNLGVALTLTGDCAAAGRALDEAVRTAGGETTVGYVALAFLAIIDLREGDEEGAFQHARRAHATAERPGWRKFMPSVYTYGVMADVLSRRGQHDEAAEAVQRATELLPPLSESLRFRLIETRIRLAVALATLGRRDEAKARLEEAAALLAVQPDAGVLPQWHQEAVQTVRGRRATSPDLSDAERRILRLLATDLTLRDIGRELYLSHNTVKTHTRAIYRKLGVSSRAELTKAASTRDKKHRPREGSSPG